MEQITRKAYAKINLVLDVTGRLPNGYHEVSMVMQNVGIHDTLTFTKKRDEQIVLTTNDGQLPLGEDNLIYKAVLLLRELTGNKDGVTIHLEKRIPVAAGMAGGSTDAAATLLGVNELLGLGLQKSSCKRKASGSVQTFRIVCWEKQPMPGDRRKADGDRISAAGVSGCGKAGYQCINTGCIPGA